VAKWTWTGQGRVPGGIEGQGYGAGFAGRPPSRRRARAGLLRRPDRRWPDRQGSPVDLGLRQSRAPITCTREKWSGRESGSCGFAVRVVPSRKTPSCL